MHVCAHMYECLPILCICMCVHMYTRSHTCIYQVYVAEDVGFITVTEFCYTEWRMAVAFISSLAAPQFVVMTASRAVCGDYFSEPATPRSSGVVFTTSLLHCTKTPDFIWPSFLKMYYGMSRNVFFNVILTISCLCDFTDILYVLWQKWWIKFIQPLILNMSFTKKQYHVRYLSYIHVWYLIFNWFLDVKISSVNCVKGHDSDIISKAASTHLSSLFTYTTHLRAESILQRMWQCRQAIKELQYGTRLVQFFG